jgi:hypothetical protein
MLQTIYNSVISCCYKGQEDVPSYEQDSSDRPHNGSNHENSYGDERETTEDGEESEALVETTDKSNFREPIRPVDDETRHLLQSSLHNRVEEYRQALAKTEQPIRGSAPTPFKRERSTVKMIEHFESMNDSLGSSSAHRRLSTPLLDPSSKDYDGSCTRLSASIQNHVNNMPICAVCLKTIYPMDAVIYSYGRMIHSSCFTCRLCQAKLKHHPMEMQFELSEDENHALWCVCAKCQLEYIHRDIPKVLATVAGEKITVDTEELGDVQGVKDAIGDELEEILLEKTLPRCQVCSGDFLNYLGRVCIIGQMKYHNECWETGKPSANLSERQLIPYQAAKYLPDRWILRLLLVDHGNNNNVKGPCRPLATIFFVWNDRVHDFQRLVATKQVKATSIVQICLDLDDQALGNPNYYDTSKRKTQAQLPPTSPGHDIVSSSMLNCELIGNPLAGSLRHSKCEFGRHKSGTLYCQFVLQGTKFHVRHQVKFRVPMYRQQDSSTILDFSNASLTITLRQEEQKSSK